MRISKERKEALLNAIEVLNKTVGGKMQDIIAAEQEVKRHLPQIGLYLEYDDKLNQWYYADIEGDEVEL